MATTEQKTVEIPANTFPPARPDPHGWGYHRWRAIGFKPEGSPPWRIPAGCAVAVRYGDLLGPDDNPWREFETIRYQAAEIDAPEAS